MGNGKQRGTIYNRSRAQQIHNYNGIQYGKITPTDIDGAAEFHDKCFVFFELKVKNTELPYGQRLFYERLIKALRSAGKPAICIVAEHNTPVNSDIDAMRCEVRSYFDGAWHIQKDYCLLKRKIDEFVGRHAEECLHLPETL